MCCVHNFIQPAVLQRKAWILHGILVVLLSLFLCGFTLAKSESCNKLLTYLTQEKNNLSLILKDAKQALIPHNEEEYGEYFKQNEAMLALNKAKIASLESFLANQKRLQQDYNQHLKQLQQFPTVASGQISAQEKMDDINALNELNKETINLINENLSLANRYQEVLGEQARQLQLWQSKEHLRLELSKLHDQEEKLNISLVKLYENSIILQQKIKSEPEFKSSYLIEARMLLNNQIINLTQFKIAELDSQRRLAKADYLLLKNPDIRTLQTVTEVYKNAISELSDLEQSLKNMVAILKSEQQHLNDLPLKQQFIALLRLINARIAGVVIQEQTLQEDLENHQNELKKQLSVRQSLSEYRLDSWPLIFHQLSNMPTQFYNYLKSLVFKVKDNYEWQDNLSAVLLWLAAGLILIGAFRFNKVLKRITHDKERLRLSGHLYDGALTLLSRNMPYLAATFVLTIIFYFNRVPFVSYQLVLNLIFVWLTFRTLILIARLVLLERITDSSGTDVRLYYRIKWLLMIGGWTTALMVFSHLLPLPILLQDIFNRLFMMFLLAVSFVLWKSKEVITQLMHPILKYKKRYLRNAIMLLVILVPLTLFTTAVIGLIGYINLAWTMSSYQMQLLLLVTFYVLLRGLLFDALELLSEWMISSLNNGWLWIEVFLKPLDKIMRILLMLLSGFILCQLFGWQSDSTVATTMIQFVEHPLVNLSGIHITLLSILEFILLLSIFMWIAKWTREFCYRWLYRDARDAGIRNSLSVFTQYAVILIGGFITLRVLGLDFSGMSVVIGGLAVGMGFGLRDFASNIIGGLMLLIERPVREGDLITLGDYEGRVSHIGIRSMRVSSWDNMEVLIPNAETFNKPFTNWTHQDSIIRTVVPIKVSRADDPNIVQQLILDVLAIIPEIVAEPPPQVLLKKIDEALVEFEIRYFINVQIHTRFEIRSKILFAITAQFNAAGIRPPIPPLSIEIKDNKSEEANRSKNSATD